jgi:opacity protein-like surface antigen
MNIKKLLISAVLPVLFLSTAAAQDKACASDNTPKKGDVTLAATVGYNSYASVTALPGNLYTYEASAIATDWSDKKLMVGLEGGWFVGNFWKLSLGGGLTFTNNPGYTGVPGTVDESLSIEDNLGDIPNYRAVADAYSFGYNVTAGIDRYFNMKSVKNMMLYTGLRLGFAYGLNEQKYDEWMSMGKSTAEACNFRAAWTFGVDYFVRPGMFVGISVDPVAYTYNVTSYKPQEGLATLQADSHNFGLLAAPTIRLGFKF